MSFALKESEGTWAMVTGASSGFGAAYAKRLAALGYSLVLHGRDTDRLQALADDLQAEHKCRVETLQADLASDEGIARAVQAADRPGLRILVNNAGYGDPGLFQEREVEAFIAMQKVHNEAAVRLAHVAVRRMLEQGSGAVVNVASVAAWLPGRGSVMYSATKAFLTAFSRSLAADLHGTGVVVQSLCPGLTHTGFHDAGKPAYLDKSRTPRWLWMECDTVVDFSLRMLGRGRVVQIPGVVNRIFAWVGGHDWLYRRLVGNVRKK